MPGWDPKEDAYLSGFADGEASFLLTRKRKSVPGGSEVIGTQCRFSIGLRFDDGAILETLRASFGGTVLFGDAGRTGNRHPRFTWNVNAKADLLGLVDYFDRFPLRAKKANDYAIWREAVVIYTTEGFKDPRLPQLREALAAVRKVPA